MSEKWEDYTDAGVILSGYMVGNLIFDEKKIYAPYRQYYQRPEISFNKILNTSPIRHGLRSRHGVNCQK